MRRTRVWLMNHYATDMFFNKGGRHYWFAERLVANGYEPTIFCANVKHNTDETLDLAGRRYLARTVNQIPFVFVKTCRSKGNGIDRVLNMSLFFLNLFPAAKQYANAHGKPDVIIASSVHPLTMVAGLKIAERFGVPCICEVRDLWPEAIFAFNKAREDSILGRLLIAGEHWIYRKADALIFTKEGDVDYIRERCWDMSQGGDIDLSKAHYINNGVDIEAFQELSKQTILEDKDLDVGKFNVVYVGAMRPVNDVGKLLDAASLLKDHEDIQFLIYGDGNQRETLDRRVSDEDLSNVKMKGFVSKQFIPYILSKASVNILSYSQTRYNWTRGNSSNKLFEYMASGKPIVSTVKMGYSIIDRYKCGIELENASAQDLAEAILEVKNMPKEKYELLGQNAKAGALDFDFKVLSNKLIDLIERVRLKG